MSLDVAPDGKTIVFDLLGDLYTVPITGGTATRITSGMAFNHQPRYSPDGQHLAFVSDRGGSENVWIADRDGRHARQLSILSGSGGRGAVTSPAWSPDGRSVVVSQRLSREDGNASAWLLAAYDLMTGSMRWVSDTTYSREYPTLGPAFTPDGGSLYAAANVFPASLQAYMRNSWGQLGMWRLARVDVESGILTPDMGAHVSRMAVRPLISPDGRYLAYVSSDSGSQFGFRLRELATNRERWLVRTGLDAPPRDARVRESRDLAAAYAFTPDAKALIAGYGGKLRRIELATGRVAIVPFVVDVERPLGSLTVHQHTLPDTAVRTRSAAQPTLSPDGKRVAFSSLDRIWVMELPHDGRPAGVPHRLTADSVGEFYPSWSPDGEWIAYSTWLDGEGGAVRRTRVVFNVNEPLARSERITGDTALYFNTAVSPDGRRVVAVRSALPPGRQLTYEESLAPLGALTPRGTPMLVWLPAGGGLPQTVTSLDEMREFGAEYPAFQVYFTDDPERIFVGLTSWRWDGSDRRQTVAVRASDGHAGDPYFCPSGGRIVLSPDQRRAIDACYFALFEIVLPPQRTGTMDTLSLERAGKIPGGAAPGAVRRWGTAFDPWVSWSRDSRRVLFQQAGTFFLGEVRSNEWTAFARVDVPLKVPIDVPRGTVVLRNARLITMRGKEVIERGDIVVRDNRIAAVGPVGRIALPKDARVFDLSGTTILPGYVDLHDHEPLPAGVHPQQWWERLARLGLGVTATRTFYDMFAYQELDRAGAFLGPRMFSTGTAYLGTSPPIQTLADARERVRPHTQYFDTEGFKVYHDHSTDRRAWQLLAMAAAEHGLNATAHTNGIVAELTHAIDGLSGIEHAPWSPAIAVYDDVATLLARSGTTQTMTYAGVLIGAWDYMAKQHGAPWESETLRRLTPSSSWAVLHYQLAVAGLETVATDPAALVPLLSGAARIVAQGGRVAIGSHGSGSPLGFHYEMWLHALGGMPNHEILRSATIVGATAIGHTTDFGSLEVGKLADLQVLEKNPLDNIHNTTSIRYVMKNGRLYQADDITELWPRQKPLASIYLADSNTAGAERRADGDSANKGPGGRQFH